jgi:uncharacterized protein YndB with AHSA1/START domain
MLSTILTIGVGFIIGVVAIATLMPKKSSLTVETLINSPNNEVFDYVKHLKNQEKYSKWVMADPNVKMTYAGTDGTVGFKAAWVSADKNVGIGEQEITNIVENARYDVEIRFEKPFKGISTAYTTTEAISENQTRVTNTFNSSTPFPMNVMLPFIKRMLTKDMNITMSRLKENLEK